MSNFVWDPNANQTFTPADGNDQSPLTGPAVSFDKTTGYGIDTTGQLSIAISDAGTTRWGTEDAAPPVNQITKFNILPDNGSFKFSSPGKLIVGSKDLPVEFIVDKNITNENSPKENFILNVNEIVFTSATIKTINGVCVVIGGTAGVNSNHMRIEQALILVDQGSTCKITPSYNEKSLDILNMNCRVSGNSNAVISSVNIIDGGNVTFYLISTSDGDYSHYEIYGMDFIKNNYQKSIFQFITNHGNSKGSFTFHGVGSMFQLNAMLQKGLLAIDGNNDLNYVQSRINYDSPDIFQNDAMYIRLR